MNIYDFDHTIYSGDSTIDFYFYCLQKKPLIIKYLPRQIFNFIKFKLKIITRDNFKEKFFIFLKDYSAIEPIINNFWLKNKRKIKKWYLDKDHQKDIIISASPEFLLIPICNDLKVNDLIATRIDLHTGKIKGKNCYGIEKVKRLQALYPRIKIDECYTDSLSDLPILKLAKKGYLVKKNKLILYQEKI